MNKKNLYQLKKKVGFFYFQQERKVYKQPLFATTTFILVFEKKKNFP